jgi:preprotein translocase subunit YajC
MLSAALPVLLAATKSTTKSSGSPVVLIVLVGVVAAVYFLFLRPQQQRQRAQRTQRSDVAVGDEVLTVGGIVGRVIDVNTEHITIVTGEGSDDAAPGSTPTRLVLVKQGIARKIEPVVEPDYNYPDEDDEDDEASAHDDEAEHPDDEGEGGGPTNGRRAK